MITAKRTVPEKTIDVNSGSITIRPPHYEPDQQHNAMVSFGIDDVRAVELTEQEQQTLQAFLVNVAKRAKDKNENAAFDSRTVKATAYQLPEQPHI